MIHASISSVFCHCKLYSLLTILSLFMSFRFITKKKFYAFHFCNSVYWIFNLHVKIFKRILNEEARHLVTQLGNKLSQADDCNVSRLFSFTIISSPKCVSWNFINWHLFDAESKVVWESFSTSHLLHQLHLAKLTWKNGRKYLNFSRQIYIGFWHCLITSINLFFQPYYVYSNIF